MTRDISIECVVCHRTTKMTVSQPELYSHPTIRNNWVCLLCEKKVNKLKIILTCKKCHKEFHTKILMSNKDNYSKEWECPLCAKVEDDRDKRKKTLELNCDGCKAKCGVCFHADLNCSLSSEYIVFGSSELYSTQKECTILSIDEIDMSRTDIHSMKYVLLYNSKYLISTKNVILIKQRVGSKKNHTTKVSIYSYDSKKKGFALSSEKEYEKSVDWILPTRDAIKSLLDGCK